MKLTEAFKIVLDLANQNVADDLDHPEENARQEYAIEKVTQIMQGLESGLIPMPTTLPPVRDGWEPVFTPWRHGGWYVTNVHYPKGGVGCVSNNYEDKKWRIACDPRPFEERPTFASRRDAALAERDLVRVLTLRQMMGED